MREEPCEVIDHAGLNIEIYQDTDAQRPDEWGDDGLFLVANHRDFFITPPYDTKSRNFTAEEVVEHYKKTHHIFGLEAYIHSGVVLAMSREGNFPDRRWDVSQLGYVFASKKEWRLRKSAEKAARGLIETWNQYLSGDVYGFVIKSGDGEDLADMSDSCWGFYGMEAVLEDAKSSAEHIAKSIRDRKAKKLKAYIVNKVDLAKRSLKI